MKKVFIIEGVPVGKPRQTRSDKWKKRPCVMKYRNWADSARRQAGNISFNPVGLSVFAFLPMPESWSAKKRAEMIGKYHRQKPDADNIFKSVADALFKEDKSISIMFCVKRWSRGGGHCLIQIW